MKKLFALLLALMMVFALAACGNNETPLGSQDKTNNSNMGNMDISDIESALDELEQLIPEGWDENNYGAYIYNVWDSDFLPDCFPEAPDGIKVDQTTFKDYKHDRINGSYAVGPLYYDSKEDYREYGVFFYATKAQLDTFTAAVEAKGMNGGITEEGEWTYYNYFGNGWFMEIFVRNSISEENYEYSVSVSATDSLFALPKSIDGIPLPQCGMTDSDYNKNYTIQDFTNGYEDVDFNLESDKLPEASYAAWFEYHCSTNQDSMDYSAKLKELGWEVVWESNEENGHRCALEKDGVYAVSNYIADDCVLQVGFSDMIENLSY